MEAVFTRPCYISSCHMRCHPDWVECVRLAAEAGYQGVELFGDEALLSRDLSPVRDEAARLGLTLTAHPWINWQDWTLAEQIGGTTRLLDALAKANVHLVNLHMDFYDRRENGTARFLALTKALLPVLERNGQLLTVENVPPGFNGGLGDSAEDFAQLFHFLGADAPVALNIDVGHAFVAGELEVYANRFARKWAYAHLHDNHGETDEHLAPGEGAVDWRAFAALVAEANYVGPFMMEFPFAKSWDGLRALRDAGVLGD